jgi:hypothetical protein
MERMTISGNQAAPRVREALLAVVLPLVAAEMLGLGGGPIPWVLVLLTTALSVRSPKVAAKLAPFACFAYGCYGFYLARYMPGGGPGLVVYGFMRVFAGDSWGWVLPQAFAFTAAGVLLLVLTDAPGGRAVRQAWWQLRGTHGQAKTVPPLLLLPVIFLWEELWSARLGSRSPTARCRSWWPWYF